MSRLNSNYVYGASRGYRVIALPHLKLGVTCNLPVYCSTTDASLWPHEGNGFTRRYFEF